MRINKYYYDKRSKEYYKVINTRFEKVNDKNYPVYTLDNGDIFRIDEKEKHYLYDIELHSIGIINQIIAKYGEEAYPLSSEEDFKIHSLHFENRSLQGLLEELKYHRREAKKIEECLGLDRY